jgi:small subunit ribosomal protein S20
LQGCGELRLGLFRIKLAACIPISRFVRAQEKSLEVMANHVSSLKRARQTVTRTAVNRANKSKLRGTLRTLREALAAGEASTIAKTYSATVSVLDKSVQKGVLHKNTASRYKARLNARVKAVVVAKKAA